MIAFTLFTSFLTFATFQGTVFLKQDHSQKVLTYERADTKAGSEITATATYKDPSGKVILKEVTVYDENLNFKSHLVENSQLNYVGKVGREGEKKFTFELTTAGKKKSTEEEERKDRVLVSSLLSLFIKKNWDKLIAGKDVEFRLAVPQRQETIGFEFEKVDNRTLDGRSYITIKMSPSSWIISQVVDDIFFLFDEKKNLKIYEGRITPKHKIDGKWTDLDATIFY